MRGGVSPRCTVGCGVFSVLLLLVLAVELCSLNSTAPPNKSGGDLGWPLLLKKMDCCADGSLVGSSSRSFAGKNHEEIAEPSVVKECGGSVGIQAPVGSCDRCVSILSGFLLSADGWPSSDNESKVPTVDDAPLPKNTQVSSGIVAVGIESSCSFIAVSSLVQFCKGRAGGKGNVVQRPASSKTTRHPIWAIRCVTSSQVASGRDSNRGNFRQPYDKSGCSTYVVMQVEKLVVCVVFMPFGLMRRRRVRVSSMSFLRFNGEGKLQLSSVVLPKNLQLNSIPQKHLPIRLLGESLALRLVSMQEALEG